MAGIPGILNAIFGRQSPGMLGGGTDPMFGDARFGGGAAMAQLPGSAPRGGFGGFLRNNPMALLQIGGAIGSTPNWGAALGEIGQTVPQGMALDKQNREKQRQRAAMTAWLRSKQTGMDMSPEDLAYIESDPELGRMIAAEALAPKEMPTTDDIKEYQFAKENGFEGGFQDWLKVGGSGGSKTSLVPIWGEIDGEPALAQPTDTGEAMLTQLPEGFKPSKGVDKIDAGTEWILQDKQTGEVVGRVPKDIAGEAREKAAGTAQGEKIANAPKVAAQMSELETSWGLVDQAIDKALTQIDWSTVGFVGDWSKVIPGTPAFNLKETLATIQANIGFDKLQSMRENSPSGGALGQVSDFENKLLQAVRGSLAQGQTADQLKANLAQVKQYLDAVREEKRKAFQTDYGSPTGAGWQEIAPGIRIREIP